MDINTLLKWVKEHKKQLIFAGISITGIVTLILGIKNRESLALVWGSLNNVVTNKPERIPVNKLATTSIDIPVCEPAVTKTVASGRMPHSVADHIRNLPEGWKASGNKIATAAEHGFDLHPGQTWVEHYNTGGFVG